MVPVLHDVSALLTDQLCRDLAEAGFDAHTSAGTTGLRLSPGPDGIAVRWQTSEEFTALAAPSPQHDERAPDAGAGPHGSVRDAIHLAVHDLLTRLGYPAVRCPATGHVLITGLRAPQ
ncbi:hypothetical protein [Streptomyces thermolineatus]|uniref:hypothetical protein n=1 Tax=Streptomyces thermolineatus TaxID=44033 RepID=UPI0031CE848D